MFGFYMTDTGIEKVAKATAQGEKVKINTLAVGDGGKPDEDRIYERTALEHENYRKQMDDMDSYDVDRNNPNVVTIVAVVPDETGAITVNEVGFFDEEGDLIVYGVVEETSKGKGSNGSMQTIEITCYINFVNTGVENVEISVGSDGLIRLQLRVDKLEDQVANLEESNRSILEELKTFVKKEAGKGLSSNDFTQEYIDKINQNAKDIFEHSKLLSEKADAKDFVRKENGKGLSSNDFTDSWITIINNLKSAVGSGNLANATDLSNLTRRVTALENELSGLSTKLASIASTLQDLYEFVDI